MLRVGLIERRAVELDHARVPFRPRGIGLAFRLPAAAEPADESDDQYHYDDNDECGRNPISECLLFERGNHRVNGTCSVDNEPPARIVSNAINTKHSTMNQTICSMRSGILMPRTVRNP